MSDLNRNEHQSSARTILDTGERYRRLFEQSSDAILMILSDGTIIDANPACCSLFGAAFDDVRGRKIRHFYWNPDDRHAFMDQLEKNGRVTNFAWQVRRNDGSIRYCFVNSTAWRDGAGNLLAHISIVRDVTELKRAEQERLHLVTAIEQAAESIMITDAEETILYTNPAFERVTGYTSEEAVGRKAGFIMSGLHNPVYYRSLRDTLARGEVWHGRFVNRKKDGSLFHEDATISPVKDESGRIVSYVAVKRDVTREVRLEEELRQAHKMEAIGTLAGGIAHDFNNILSAIFGFTQLALDEAPKGTSMRDRLSEVLIAAERAADLVKRILTFSRKSEQEKKVITVEPLLKEVLKFLRASLPSTIEIRQNFRAPQTKVWADPTQMHQVLMNLCTNARQAMREGGGTLEVTVDCLVLDADSCDLDPDMTGGRFVRLGVTDSGKGIPPEIRDRIFDPYFTTKKQGEGTGLGLAVVHGIVKSHGGAIRVKSNPEEATTFHVFLPVAEDDADDQAASEEQPPTGHERILFVDDEGPITRIAKLMLEDLGYQVVAETDSARALEVFRQDPSAFDLVITDMTMPRMTGKEMAQEILIIRPNIPVMLCTGFSEEINRAQAEELGIRAFFMKPLNREKMAPIVRDLLDQPERSSRTTQSAETSRD
ncbi:MAG: PAS domain S-box protein [Thermodesulfobacteriota bacterium]